MLDKNDEFGDSEKLRQKKADFLKKWSTFVMPALEQSSQTELSQDEKSRYVDIISRVLEIHSQADSSKESLQFVADVFANLGSIRLFGTQPMTVPNSKVFYMKYVYMGEDKNDIPSVNLNIESMDITAGSQRLCDVPLSEFNASRVASELDSLIIQDFYKKISLNYLPEKCEANFSSEAEKCAFLSTCANRVHKNSLRGPARWILCGTESVQNFATLPAKMHTLTCFVSSKDSLASKYKMKTWCNSQLPPKAIVFGFVGATCLDAGYIWSPFQISKLDVVSGVQVSICHALSLVGPDYYLKAE